MYENMAKNKKCAECGSLVVLATRFHPLSQNLIVDCCKKATIRVKTDNRIEKSRSGLGGGWRSDPQENTSLTSRLPNPLFCCRPL